MTKTFDWTQGNALNEEDFERRLLLGFDILLSYPLPGCAIMATGSTPAEETDGGADLHPCVIDRASQRLES